MQGGAVSERLKGLRGHRRRAELARTQLMIKACSRLLTDLAAPMLEALPAPRAAPRFPWPPASGRPHCALQQHARSGAPEGQLLPRGVAAQSLGRDGGLGLPRASQAGAALEAAGQPQVTLCLEGNISAGKSSTLRMLAEVLRDSAHFVPEPVEQWQNIPGGSSRPPANLLQAFYDDPRRFAYTFQNYVFITRLMQEQQSRGCGHPLRVLERSVFSDRMVFVRALLEDGSLSPMELDIYDSWFDPVLAEYPAMVPQGFVYLQVEPGTCARRMAGRGRREESGVPLAYLENLHRKHEEWLHTGAERHSSPQAGNGSGGGAEAALSVPVPESCAGQVFRIAHRGPAAVRHIAGRPVLVLDCNEDLDWTLALAERRALAQRVLDFAGYVRQLQLGGAPTRASVPGALPLPLEQGLAAALDPQAGDGTGLGRGGRVLAVAQCGEEERLASVC